MLQFCHNCYQINMKNIFYYDALSGKNALKFGQRLHEMMPDIKENLFCCVSGVIAPPVTVSAR